MSAPITPAFAKMMARYNLWRYQSLIAASKAIGEEALRAQRGAFFGSIHGTVSHLL
ncbi:MAG: hypothetical protein AAGM38_15680 [Pseudomonadota bacterium]